MECLRKFKRNKRKNKKLTFRDLFMDLEEVTLAYSIPDSTLSQEITVSAIELRFHQISLNLMSALSQ